MACEYVRLTMLESVYVDISYYCYYFSTTDVKNDSNVS